MITFFVAFFAPLLVRLLWRVAFELQRWVVYLILFSWFPYSGLAEIIPATNAPTAVWSVAGVPNGIPTYRAVNTTLIASATPAQIISAVNALPAETVLYLSNGTYNVNSLISIQNHDKFTIRGAGMSNTILNINNASSRPIYFAGAPAWVGTTAILSGGTQGSTNITVANAAGYTVTNEVAIDMTDSGFITVFGTGNGNSATTNANAFNSQVGKSGSAPAVRSQVHYAHIVACDIANSNLTFMPPLPFPLESGRSPQISRSTTRCLQGIGIEDLTLNFTNATGIYGLVFEGTDGCWTKNVECVGWDQNFAIWLRKVTRFEERGCWIHDPRSSGANQVDHGYGLLADGCSGGLFIDNIHYNCQSPFLLQNGCTANVIIYNVFAFGRYFKDGYTGEWLQHEISGNHTPFPCYNLIEGNYTGQFQADYYYGGSGYTTLFRNRIPGRSTATTKRFMAVSIDANNRYYSVVGNSLGTTNAELSPLYLALPDDTRSFASNSAIAWAGYDSLSNAWSFDDHIGYIYRLGYPSSGNNDVGGGLRVHDAFVHTNTLRHGNWDAYNGGVVWDATIADHTLSNSFFAAAAPAFFGTNFAWPPYGPTAPVSMVDDLQKIPAGRRLLYGTNLPYGQLAVSTNFVDFGIVTHPQPLTWTGDEPVSTTTITFSNIGTASFTLTTPQNPGIYAWFRWEHSVDALSLLASPITLAPGASTNVSLIFEPFPELGLELYVPKIIRPQFVFTNGGGATISVVARTANPTTNKVAWSVSSPSDFDFATNGGFFVASADALPFIPGQSGEAYFEFTLTNRSLLNFSAYVRATNSTGDSFAVEVDGEPAYPYSVWNPTATSGSALELQNVTRQGVGSPAIHDDPFTLVLEAGNHFVKFYSQTAGTAISNLTANVTAIVNPATLAGDGSFGGGSFQ